MATLLRYTMGEGAVAVAGLGPDLVGQVLPAAVFTPHEKSVSPDIGLRAGEPSARYRVVLEVVLVQGPPSTRCSRATPSGP